MADLNTRATIRNKNSWFVCVGERNPHAPNLYCFAHAGGSAEQFLTWQACLAGVVNIVAMCPPGLAHRYAEPRCADMEALAAGASAAIDSERNERPFMLFGHSFGALLAYETCRRLKEKPTELIVSGCSAPSFLPSKKVVAMAALDGAEFLHGVRCFGGIPDELGGEGELERYIVEKLKFDFDIISRYLYSRDPLLDVRVTTINGASDPHVTPHTVMAWRSVTTAPTVHHELPGDHFYFNKHPERVTAIIRSVASARRAPPRPILETRWI